MFQGPDFQLLACWRLLVVDLVKAAFMPVAGHDDLYFVADVQCVEEGLGDRVREVDAS